ncbi:MAG TPA: hypothetical protein VIA62_04570 [Thermoanaerobaculia bacterium]|nr:hypothetical protein [Thermoanaerobaculia bacterium]
MSFTVAADRDQADRWGAAATEKCMEVPSWLAATADAHLREWARTGQAPPLFWFRDRFLVTVTDTTRRPEIVSEVSVQGFISGPFGVFRGSGRGVGAPSSSEHSLTHLPTRRIIATLSLRKSCMALAAELAVLETNWQETDPERVLQGVPDQGKVQALLRLYEKVTRT